MSDNCQSFQRELSHLLDVKGEQSKELKAHLLSCKQCQAYEKEISFLHVLALAEPMEEAPVALKSSVMARLRARQESSSRFSRFVIFEFVLCLAACTFLAVYGGPLLPQYDSPEFSLPTLHSFYPETLLSQPPTEFSLSSFYPDELIGRFVAFSQLLKTTLLEQASLSSLSPSLLALLFTMTLLTITANVLVARSNGISVPERTKDHVS